MNDNLPLISVVIPTYNQAKFLVNTLRSALAQTYRNTEIIVVDDGSTDETPKVLQEYSESIQYIRQDNQGLAGARNTGIRNAKGQFVALLDSDDLWLPSFLEIMAACIAENPGATVYYCGWRYIDTEGHVLPQSPHTWSIPQSEMFNTLLRANFIIPSTVILNRSRILEAGLFDISFRRLQDWELWLRLLIAGHVIVGSDSCLVHYRLHGGALSVDLLGGHQAAQAISEKLFGKDDGHPQAWSADKCRAYGGVYRYQSLTFIQRQNNWQAATNSLRKALQIDPSLALDLDLFYELALGTQPAGFRGTDHQLGLVKNADQIRCLLDDIFYSTGDIKKVRRSTYGTAYFALGLVAYNTGQIHLCRKYLTKAISYQPMFCLNSRVLGTLAKSSLNPRLVSKLRRLKGIGQKLVRKNNRAGT